MEMNSIIGTLLAVAGIGDIGIALVLGQRLASAARLVLIGSGAVLLVAGLLLGSGLFKLV